MAMARPVADTKMAQHSLTLVVRHRKDRFRSL
jgi:hypothetical protein